MRVHFRLAVEDEASRREEKESKKRMASRIKKNTGGRRDGKRGLWITRAQRVESSAASWPTQ